MIRNFITCLIITVVLFSSCLKPEEDYKPPEMVKEIVPGSDGGDKPEDLFELASYDSSAQKPVVPLNTNEVLINTINLNLDLDSSDEQIIVIKKRDNPEGNISIIAADYDNVKSAYTRSWSSETGASNIRSFVVYLEDIIGDHNNEIVCSGRDSSGRSTLDIFWKSNTGGNSLLNYQTVFSVAEKGTIEIIQQERSRAYQQGLKDGVSYTIAVTREETAGGDAIDLIRSDYFWDFPLKRYVKLTEEKIENTEIRERRLAEILGGDEGSFYNFIKGPWHTAAAGSSDEDLIIFFDPASKSSTFYTEDVQENYSWVNSYKVLSNLLYIRGRNEIINYIENEIYIRINSVDEITVTVKDIDNQTRVKKPNDIWTRKYRRLADSELDDTIKTIESAARTSPLPFLSGQYMSDSGDIIEFYGSDFFMKTSLEQIAGGFAVYSADIDIIDFKITDKAGLVTGTRTFALDFTEEVTERFIERTLILTPGKLSIYGFRPSDTEFYRFVQIETLEIDNEEEPAQQSE